MQKRTRISDLFYCHHLGAGETDEKDIQKFEVRDEKGVGLIIYDSFVLPIVVNTARNIGIKILYLYALPYEELISRYKKYGFKRLGQKYEKEIHSRLKPKYDKYCIFMYRILD